MENLSFDRILGIVSLVLAVVGIVLGIGVALALDAKTKGEFAFAIGCFVFAALMLSVTIGAWGYIDESSVYKRLIVSGVLFALVGTSPLEAIRWTNGRHKRASGEIVASDGSAADGPKVEFGPYFLNMTQSLESNGFYWVRYMSKYGDTASPVALTIWAGITNPRPVPLTVKTYSLSIKTQNCGWLYLAPIDERAVTAAWTYNGLQHASVHDFHRNGLNVAWDKPIPAYGTVAGWLLFDTKIACDVSPPQTVQFKLEITDNLNQTSSIVSPERDVSGKATEFGSSTGLTSHPSLFHTGTFVDLTNAHKKLWSAPVD